MGNFPASGESDHRTYRRNSTPHILDFHQIGQMFAPVHGRQEFSPANASSKIFLDHVGGSSVNTGAEIRIARFPLFGMYTRCS